ncbi:MAG: hypothetical protein ABMA13_22150 [Chthoniobacteraceae bacterium]
MAKPLTWNMPGLRWNQPGATWNGTVATPRKMSKIKAVIDFSGYAAADLAPVAQMIHDSMTTNAATFGSPPVAMTVLATSIADFDTKLAAKASRATVDVIAFNMSRHDMEGELAELGNYVNGVAKGDAMLVEKSGFPSYEAGQNAPGGVPAAPENLRLRHGDVSGEVVARYRPDRERSMNEVQKCFGDPNVEANWQHAGMYGGGKATIGGITPGALVWIRVRTCGNKGVMGAWSDPAQIRAL